MDESEAWTEGLERLDSKQTRARLASLFDKCRFVADGLEHFQAQGLRDQVAETENNLRRAAQGEIRRLAAKLTEYRSGPPPAPEPVRYCAHRAAAERYRAREAAEAAAAAAPDPEPVAETASPATRPVPPVRGMRLPPLAPRRS